jgi:hypothetical protein
MRASVDNGSTFFGTSLVITEPSVDYNSTSDLRGSLRTYPQSGGLFESSVSKVSSNFFSLPLRLSDRTPPNMNAIEFRWSVNDFTTPINTEANAGKIFVYEVV